MAADKTVKVKKKKSLFTIISLIIIALMIVACMVSFIVTQFSVAKMETELKTYDAKTEEILAENVELQRILEDDDMNAYMEKIAVEEMDYAYPNERRYYDTSRN